jgi:hypothetical protein
MELTIFFCIVLIGWLIYNPNIAVKLNHIVNDLIYEYKYKNKENKKD